MLKSIEVHGSDKVQLDLDDNSMNNAVDKYIDKLKQIRFDPIFSSLPSNCVLIDIKVQWIIHIWYHI